MRLNITLQTNPQRLEALKAASLMPRNTLADGSPFPPQSPLALREVCFAYFVASTNQVVTTRIGRHFLGVLLLQGRSGIQSFSSEGFLWPEVIDISDGPRRCRPNP
jgi:hypothetical protein